DMRQSPTDNSQEPRIRGPKDVMHTDEKTLRKDSKISNSKTKGRKNTPVIKYQKQLPIMISATMAPVTTILMAKAR
ncbi:8881_t:CDS:1, partial [Gigaspora rosea]